MTRIESIFGAVLAVGILGIFAFVFFGEGTLSVANSTRTTVDRTATISVSLYGDEDEYIPPQTKCDCYNYAYDFARDGVAAGSVDYDSQLSICYDKFGAMGSAAFELGFGDFMAEPRRRKSCPAGDL